MVAVDGFIKIVPGATPLTRTACGSYIGAHSHRRPTSLSAIPLEEKIRQASRRARASGELLPIETRAERVQDAGIAFVVRIAQNLRRKAAAAHDPREVFPPPADSDLQVGELGARHAVVLNKYSVLPGHILIVTQAEEAQTRLLTHADMAALLAALQQIDGLGFYNGGKEAGASQTHKHLQLVPRGSAAHGAAIPFEALFETEAAIEDDGIGCVPRLPFRHAIAAVPPSWWQQPDRGATAALDTYRRLLEACGLDSTGPSQSGAYNLLMTRRWMWLVPRGQERSAGVSVNALGFAGALLAASEAQLEALKRMGPLQVLAEAGVASPVTRSAGVVLVRHVGGQPHYLLLRAWRYWDFPKGEMENGDTALQTAMREVREETGLRRPEWRWGHAFIETPAYARGKVARYYVAAAPQGDVRLGISPALGRPEHHEFRWLTLSEARALAGERVRRVLEWAARCVGDPGA